MSTVKAVENDENVTENVSGDALRNARGILVRPELIYADADVVVAVKPRGYISEHANGVNNGEGDEAGTGANTKGVLSLPDELAQLPELSGKRGRKQAASLYTVHRLDRETEGLIVFARNAKAAAALSEAIQSGAFHKEYEAWVHGVPNAPEAVLEDWLYKDARTHKVYAVNRPRAGVRFARLIYKLLETREFQAPVPAETADGRLADAETAAAKNADPETTGAETAPRVYRISRLRIVPETGRTHQIRVQFASRKLPLLGDRRYGARDNQLPVALCSVKLEFPQPFTGAPLVFELPFEYPLDFGAEL